MALRTALLASVILAALAGRAAAAPMTGPGPYINYSPNVGQAFTTEFRPNIVNLWSNRAFNGFAGALPAGWSYYQPDVVANFVQVYTTGPSGGANAGWTQLFHGTSSLNGTSIDWQEVNYNWSTGQITGGTVGNITNTGGWVNNPALYGSVGAPGTPGAPVLLGPVPEPGTLGLLAAGAVAAAVGGWRRRRDEAAPAA